jgi:hypothetical protein
VKELATHGPWQAIRDVNDELALTLASCYRVARVRARLNRERLTADRDEFGDQTQPAARNAAQGRDAGKEKSEMDEKASGSTQGNQGGENEDEEHNWGRIRVIKTLDDIADELLALSGRRAECDPAWRPRYEAFKRWLRERGHG